MINRFLACVAIGGMLVPCWASAISPEAARQVTRAVSYERLVDAVDEPDNWLSHGRTYDEQRFSPLKLIRAENVNRLGLAWSFDTNTNRGLEASPIVVDGVLYATGTWSVVYALDAVTGELLWEYDPKVPRAWAKMACCDVVNRGVAVLEGKVFSATLDGRLVALDAGTGEVIWDVKTVDHYLDKRYPYTITGAPRIVKDKVLIGNGGAEYGVRGYLGAYDAETGRRIWRFYTVPGNPAEGFEDEAQEMAAKTWTGEWWKTGGGGTVWDSMAYDPDLNLLYIGVGNGSPWNRWIRSPEGGDNLFTASIVALNPDIGAYVWHYQETPAEAWDYTSTQHIILADLEFDGKPREVILHAPKNGFFFVIDRSDGTLLSAEPYSDLNWASGYDLATGRPNVNEAALYRGARKLVRPSSMGAHNWQPMAFNPDTGLVYIPVIDTAANFEDAGGYTHEPGHWNLGLTAPDSPPGDALLGSILLPRINLGRLIAWDPKLQREIWRVDHPKTWNGGVLTTAGNLVFQGTADRRLVAYRADSGKKLWEYPTQSGVMAPPVTYSVNGEQYVTVLAGWGGVFGLAGGLKPPPGPERSRILTFKLDAQEKLPPIPEPAPLPDPPPRIPASDQTLDKGRELYQMYCSACHGNKAVSSRGIPDLRHLPEAYHDLWDRIVLDGIFSNLGMVGFKDVLSQEDADAIHAFVIEKAYEDRALRESRGSFPYQVRKTLYEIFSDALAWLMKRLS